MEVVDLTQDQEEQTKAALGLVHRAMKEMHESVPPPPKDTPALRWCFTWNNYTPRDVCDVEEFAKDHCSYLIYGKEKGKEGTPHLQGFFRLQSRMSLTRLKVLLGKHPHFEKAVADDAKNIEYCSKEGEFVEFGDRPEALEVQKAQGEREKNRWQLAVELARNGLVDEVDPQIQVSFWGNLQKIRVAHQPPVQDLPDLENWWFYGVPGTGKSTEARKRWPGLFSKPQNKWWDAYQNEETVLIDDFDHSGRPLGHYLKIWTDKFGFQGEIKGSSLTIRPKRFVITSNYSIMEIFGDDPELCSAILRRFKVVFFPFLGGFQEIANPSYKQVVPKASVPTFVLPKIPMGVSEKTPPTGIIGGSPSAPNRPPKRMERLILVDEDEELIEEEGEFIVRKKLRFDEQTQPMDD